MAAGRRSVGRAFRAVAVDTSALRDSRDYRLLVLGGFVSGLGTQLTLVALPYQVYVQTGSSLLVGLIGLAELIPLVALSLIGGALADRGDRRRLLMLSQAAMLVCSLLLALGAIAGSPPTAALFVLAGLAAAASAVDRPARSAMLPNVVGPERLRAAISFNYGLFQLTMVVGPALAGIIIGTLGLRAAYGLDAASFLVMLAMVGLMRPQPAPQAGQPEPFLRSVRSGLSFAARHGELMGSFAIDLVAMTFGMPRALFPALALTVYNAGPEGVGLLYAAVSAGAVVAALTTGWLGHVRRLGRIVVGAVAVWGASIALLGLTGKLAVAMVCLLAAGAADSVSAVCRSTIMQTATPDALRGRMSSVFLLVVTSGPRLGDIESGAVASLVSPRFSVVSGGVATVAGVGLVALAFPGLAAYDGEAVEA